jgi:hypothetical protein
MSKPTITDSLSSLEKKGAIEAALAGDMEPVDIFTAILQNVYGITERKRVVVEWGRKSLSVKNGKELPNKIQTRSRETTDSFYPLLTAHFGVLLTNRLN